MAEIRVIEKYCKSCSLCILACPKEVLQIGTKVNEKGYEIVYYSEGLALIVRNPFYVGENG